MKKLTISLAMAATVCVTAGAQQLTNAGFEDNWTDMQCWAAGSYKTNGKAPSPWKISNVADPSVAKCVVGEKVTGYNSGAAVRVFNKSMVGKTVPGYLTLGQPWSTAKGISGGNADGGSFGGIDFAYRPDAVAFMYKSEGSKQPAVVAYGWKGTWTQASVPSNIVLTGSPKTVDMVDRDRNILGMSTSQGGAVSKSGDALLIFSKTARLEASAADWTEGLVELDYASAETPAKFNLIFSSDDYFASSQTAGEALTVDDVKIIYYSRLASVSFGGTAVEGFDSKTYAYDLTDHALPAADAVSYELLGAAKGAKAEVSVDEENAKLTVTVSQAAGCTDIDGENTHAYVFSFKKDAGSEDPKTGTEVTYDGTVTILKNEDLGLAEDFPQAGKVTITRYDDGTCDFFLPDFGLGEGEENKIGDILVKDVKTTTDGSVTNYSGVTKGLELSLAGTPIVANVEIEGTTTAAGTAAMKIHVLWLPDPVNDPEGEYGIRIEVEFNGKTQPTAISGVVTDNADAPVEYYNIQGMRVNPEHLTPGLYIRRQGNDVKKIYLR